MANSPNENPIDEELIFTWSSSSSSSSSSSPPRPLPPLIIRSGPGGSSSGGPGEKKKKGEGESGSGQKRKRGEMDAPKSEPICSLCGKKFGSWKGVFGHMRAHPERDWRGAFPPPKGDVAGWSPIRDLPVLVTEDQHVRPEDLLAPTLLRLAQETLAKMKEDQPSPSVRATDIDLNKDPEEAAGSSSPPPTPPPHGGDSGLDLNLPPAPEKDDQKDK